MSEINKKITILADSVYCGTLMDENGRYYYTSSEYHKAIEAESGMQIYDLSSFGLTSEKARNKFNAYIDSVTEENKPDYFLIALGGNDCDRNWRAIAENPEGEHGSKVNPERYIENLSYFIEKIKEKNITPIVASLAPIDSEKFWSFICKLADGTKVIEWLKNINKLYAWQEYYSHISTNFARKEGVLLLDVRGKFLADLDPDLYINKDGIHLTKEGYIKLFAVINDFFKTI